MKDAYPLSLHISSWRWLQQLQDKLPSQLLHWLLYQAPLSSKRILCPGTQQPMFPRLSFQRSSSWFLSMGGWQMGGERRNFHSISDASFAQEQQTMALALGFSQHCQPQPYWGPSELLRQALLSSHTCWVVCLPESSARQLPGASPTGALVLAPGNITLLPCYISPRAGAASEVIGSILWFPFGPPTLT